MIDINLIPDDPASAPARAPGTAPVRWPTVVLALGGAVVAVLVVLNAHYGLAVIPTLERRIVAAELSLAEREKAIAQAARDETALAAVRDRVAAAKGAYVDRRLWAPVLAKVRAAVAAADASQDGGGAVRLSAVEAEKGTLRLHGFAAGPAAGDAAAAIAEALTASGSEASVDAAEPAGDGRERFTITVTVQP